MKRTILMLLSLFIVSLLMLPSAAFAQAETTITKVIKSVGATSDSATAAPDTSSTMFLDRTHSAMWGIAMCDSAMVYTIQITWDGTRWWQIDKDTVTAGVIESTGDLGDDYQGFGLRVIQDADSAAGYGNVLIYQKQ